MEGRIEARVGDVTLGSAGRIDRRGYRRRYRRAKYEDECGFGRCVTAQVLFAEGGDMPQFCAAECVKT